MEKRAKLFEKLLLEHKALSKQHSAVQLELRNKGIKLFPFVRQHYADKIVVLLSLSFLSFISDISLWIEGADG